MNHIVADILFPETVHSEDYLVLGSVIFGYFAECVSDNVRQDCLRKAISLLGRPNTCQGDYESVY